jgi:DNA invertase Pin-like site-specific DNA recombinase
MRRAALYVRVSTDRQTVVKKLNQINIDDLIRYARGPSK